MTNTQYAAHTNSTRRRWLQALASTPLVPTLTAPALAEGATKTKAHIVIANENFDGYTSCPLITREGSAMLIEFDYEGNLTPTLPMIEPLQDSFFAWLMKVRMLKPAYISVLKGRV